MATKLIAVSEDNYKWLNGLRVVSVEDKKVESFSSVISRIRAKIGGATLIDQVIGQ